MKLIIHKMKFWGSGIIYDNSMHNSECSFAVYVNLCKTFDAVILNIIFGKLPTSGVRGRVFV